MNRTNEQMQLCVDINYQDYSKRAAVKDVAILLVRLRGERRATRLLFALLFATGVTFLAFVLGDLP